MAKKCEMCGKEVEKEAYCPFRCLKCEQILNIEIERQCIKNAPKF